jgi:hypothetical protein
MGVDEISSLIRFLGRLLTQPWATVDIRLSSGKKLTGHRHPYWSSTGAKLKLLGRTLDLAKAYRQLASSPKTSRWSVIAVWSPVDRCALLFYQPVLAFGAASAVLVFNRTSRALWHIGCTQFSLIWTNFFDDFPTIEVEELSSSSLLCSEGFLKLLGWEYSVKESKRLPFSAQFIALGVQYDLSNIFSERFLQVQNKPGRIADIDAFVKALQLAKRITRRDYEVLAGRLQYAESFTYGRLSRFVMGPLKSAVFGMGVSSALFTAAMDESCCLLCSCINTALPRRIPLSFDPLYTIAFTDGACEGAELGLVTCGAVVHEIGIAGTWWFHLRVPDDLVSYWKSSGDKQQVIAEAELFPIIVAREMIRPCEQLRLLVQYVDNDGVSDSLIKGFSNVLALQFLLREYVQQEVSLSAVSWVARVPSPSNPADAPSRSHVCCNDGYDRGLDRSIEALIICARISAKILSR